MGSLDSKGSFRAMARGGLHSCIMMDALRDLLVASPGATGSKKTSCLLRFVLQASFTRTTVSWSSWSGVADALPSRFVTA